MKVGDLGLSTQLNSSVSQRGQVNGTPLFMAPEVFEEKTCLKSDIWSLGISALQLAEPDNPFFSLTSYGSVTTA